MATASVPVQPDERNCSVCHKQFTKPKLLPCGHLLCRHCLLSLLRPQAGAECPLCRCSIVKPEGWGNKSPNDIADGFPTDLAMEALVEAESLLNERHNCRVCATVAATCLCLNCRDVFCKDCGTLHNKQPVLRHHIVEDLSSVTPQRIAANRPAICAAHADKTCDYFCPTHSMAICQVCATAQHRNCPEVQDLEKKAEEAREVLAALAVRLSAGETELNTTISHLDRRLKQTERQTRAIIAEIETTCERLESASKACRHRLKNLAWSASSDAKELVLVGEASLLERREKLTLHKHVIERVRKSKSSGTVAEMTSVIETCVDGLDFSVTLPAETNVIPMVTLAIDSIEVSLVERVLSKLGQVKVVHANVEATEQATAFSFHDNHGTNIVLSNNKQTAQRRLGDFHGMVMSRDPMMTSVVYEVKVEETDARWESALIGLGVVTQSPGSVTLLKMSGNLKCVVGVSPVSYTVKSSSSECTTFSELHNVRVGSRIGVEVDTNGHLQVSLDGQNQGVLQPGTPLTHPSYAFFDLGCRLKKVTVLPLRKQAVTKKDEGCKNQ